MKPLLVNIRKKTYSNGCCAIENLSFGVQPGEFVALVGPSGSGKTTLLNLIAGLDLQMEGQVSFDTEGLPGGRPRIGFMFQEPRLMPWLTVQQNLELVLPAATRARQTVPLRQWLERVGLPDCAQLFPGQLSGGMQRRVALLRAFIVKPDVLLMDEPFQSLDAPTAQQLRTLLHDLCERTQPTVLFVTHSLREALSLADRVLFLSAGPSTVILDYPVVLKKPRAIEDSAAQAMHDALLAQYPRILSGVLYS